MDVHSLVPGQRFDKELNRALDKCSVFVAVVGPKWMEMLAKREAGGEHDYVRQELATALKRDMVVIPVLVEGARLPAATSLPADIKDLLMHQKQEITHERFNHDLSDLVRAIGGTSFSGRSRTHIYAAAVVALVALIGTSIYLASSSGSMRQRLSSVFASEQKQKSQQKNRRVKINNNSSTRVVNKLYAVPSSMRASLISGVDWLSSAMVHPGQHVVINFDDGQGTCTYDLRALSNMPNVEWIRRDFDVCTKEEWNLAE